MANQIASGQITITDLNDGRTFIMRITDSLLSGGYFSYNPDNGTYHPNILNSGITLNAMLHTTSSSNNMLDATDQVAVDKVYVRNKKWTRADSTTSLGSGKSLVITSANVETELFKDGVNTVNYTFSCEIREELYDVWTPFQASFAFNRVKQGLGANYIYLNATPSEMFVNAADEDLIVIKANIFESGKPVLAPVSLDYYKWYFYDDETGAFVEVSQLQLGTPATWNTLTITSREIFGSEIFKYTAKFNDEDDPIEASKVIVDYTDPIAIYVSSESGNVFKPGMQNKLLKANIQKKVGDRHEIITDEEAAAEYDFSWKAFDKDGKEMTTLTFPALQTITVTPSMVDVAATFIVSVFEKTTVQSARALMSQQYGFRNFLIR